MREAVYETIDGHEYEFLQLGARKSFIVLNRLLKLGAPGLGKAVSALKVGSTADILNAEVDESVVADAITELGAGLDENENVKTAEMLFESATYKGIKCSFETETFQGDLFHMIKVLKKAAEVNIGDFFAAFKERVDTAVERPTGRGKTTSSRIGSSGVSSLRKSRP